MPVFAETSSEFVSTNDQEAAKSPNVMTLTLMTLTSCTIREGAKQGSSGAKRKCLKDTSYQPNTWMMRLIGMLLQQWTAIKDGLEVES